jgi:hypothetical protein
MFGGAAMPWSPQYTWFADLWKYDSATGLWAWVGGSQVTNTSSYHGTLGVAADYTRPGARGAAAAWVDGDGAFWLFGGLGYDAFGIGLLNDLWRYEPATGLWTWMGGSKEYGWPGVYGTLGTAADANVPGARAGSATWVDANGDLWMFGGYGSAASTVGHLGDLWRYQPATHRWTWMSGSDAADAPVAHGALGVADAANTPGARTSASTWSDAAGNLWLFGGEVENENVFMNDLWRYEPATGLWTWMGGATTTNDDGSFGTKGVSAAESWPGARRSAVTWNDGSGVAWLFGGYGSTGIGYRDDLWRFEVATGMWTWMAGTGMPGASSSVVGTQGVAAPDNVHGARAGAAAWTDADGNHWMFGGYYADSSFNELWVHLPP